MLDMDHIEPKSRFAGFASRAVAVVLDLFLFLAAAAIIRITLQVLFAFADRIIPFIDLEGIANQLEVGRVLGGGLLQMLYFVLFWAAMGQTPGMVLLGIKVVRPDGQPPGLLRAFARYFGFIVSLLALGLGFIWVLFDRQRQGWFDKIAGTYVVYSKEARLYHAQRAKSTSRLSATIEEPVVPGAVKAAPR